MRASCANGAWRPDFGAGWGAALVLGASLLSAGCAGRTDELAKQVDGLRRDLLAARAENAAMSERIGALEKPRSKSLLPGPGAGAGVVETVDSVADRSSVDSAPPPATEKSGPELVVVKLAPTDTAPSERAEIEQGGGLVKIRSTPGGVVKETSGNDPAEAVGNAELKRARELFEKKSYEKAETAFGSFVSRFADHPKVADATYYRGLAFVATGDALHAAQQFESVTTSFPKHVLVPDALLELARAQEKLGHTDAADRARSKLKTDFPKSAAARKLDKRRGT